MKNSSCSEVTRKTRTRWSHSTFSDRQEEETHVNAHSYTFTHVNTFITSLIKQTPHIQPLKEAYGCTRVQTHTHSNTLTMKEFGLLPTLHQSSDIPPVNSTPASVCVCVCVCVCVWERGKHWQDRGVTHYSTGVSMFLRSTIKTPLVFWSVDVSRISTAYRQTDWRCERASTNICSKSEWCENISLKTWAWCSLRAGLNFVITAITASCCINLCVTRRSAGELWWVWHILSWNGIVMLLNIMQKQDNMS